jgi:hypothetical protein
MGEGQWQEGPGADKTARIEQTDENLRAAEIEPAPTVEVGGEQYSAEVLEKLDRLSADDIARFGGRAKIAESLQLADDINATIVHRQFEGIKKIAQEQEARRNQYPWEGQPEQKKD